MTFTSLAQCVQSAFRKLKNGTLKANFHPGETLKDKVFLFSACEPLIWSFIVFYFYQVNRSSVLAKFQLDIDSLANVHHAITFVQIGL